MPSGIYKKTKEHRKNLSKAQKGKTWEEIYGIEVAEERRERQNIRRKTRE